MSHTSFIVSAYLVAAVLLGGLIVMTALDYRRQKARLSEHAPNDGEEQP